MDRCQGGGRGRTLTPGCHYPGASDGQLTAQWVIIRTTGQKNTKSTNAIGKWQTFSRTLAPSKPFKDTYKGLLGHFGTQNLLMVHWQCARIIVVTTPGSLTTMTTALMQGMDGHWGGHWTLGAMCRPDVYDQVWPHKIIFNYPRREVLKSPWLKRR